MRDLWRFDFENVQAQGNDLVGVVPERLASEVPFDVELLIATETALVATSTEAHDEGATSDFG